MRTTFFAVGLWLWLCLPSCGQLPSPGIPSSVDGLLHRADSFRREGLVQETLQSYFTALRQSESAKYTYGTIQASIRLGELYERYYRSVEAISYYRTAYEYARHTDSLRTTARLCNSLAWNYHKIDQVDSALRYAEEAVARYRALPDRSAMSFAVALESLGEIYSQLGRYPDAERALNECMATGISANNEVIQGFTRYGLAFNAFNQQKYQEARTQILRCVPVAEEYASTELLAQVYRLAYQVHERIGKEREALHFLQRFTALNDRLHSEDIEKKAAIINANFEIQKKEDDLRLLAQQNAIQQLEIEQRSLTQKITIGTGITLLLIAALIYNRIQNQRNFERKEHQRKKEELEQARKVQLSLLPRKPLVNEQFEVNGKMITATEVGGDYFDFVPLDDHRVLIAFGDATGHGMTAGMMVTITKVALLNNLGLLKDNNDVVPVARAVNESILASVSVKGIGMALQLCVIDSLKQTVSMTSCGMPYPVLTNPVAGTLDTAVMRQPPLGFMRGTKMELKEMSFTKGDLLVLASDGILERFNRSKEEYGLTRFTDHLQRAVAPSSDLQHLLDSIFLDAENFASGVAHHDDMTALCARLR